MKSLAFILICLSMGGATAYYAEPYTRDNADVTLILITVFTVFAGFLVAIIVILGDPAFIVGKSWRSVELGRDKIERRILLHIALFILYLIAIAFVFIGAIVRKVPDELVGELIKVWINRAYLFFGVSAFLFSLALPSSLFRVQMGRLDKETEERRAEVGIRDNS